MVFTDLTAYFLGLIDLAIHLLTHSLTNLGIPHRTRQRSGGNCGEVLNYTPADQRDHTSFDLGREIVLFQRNARGVCGYERKEV